MQDFTAEILRARQVDDVRRAVGAGRENELSGFECDRARFANDLDGPLLFRGIEAGRFDLGRAPVVELHRRDVGLDPVAHLVLRREDRPALRERHVGKMIVPHRVVQHERPVAVAPRIARPRVLLRDDGRHAELPKAGAQHDAPLPAADDEAIGLLGDAERCALRREPLAPVPPVACGLMGRAERSRDLDALLEAVEGLKRRENRAAESIFETKDAPPASRAHRHGEPRLHTARDALGFFQCPTRGRSRAERRPEHFGDCGFALRRPDVPGERQEVAPVTIVGEQGERAGDVAAGQGIAETGEPASGFRPDCVCVHRLACSRRR